MVRGMATEASTTPATARVVWRRYLAKPTQEQIVLLVTLALIIGFSVALPGFATVANLLNLAKSVSILGILGLGMAIVVIARGLDLSQVAIMAVSLGIALTLMTNGVSTPVALLAVLVLALAIGAINGLIIAFIEVPALFATLATTFVAFGRGRLVLRTLFIYAPPTATGLFFIGQGRILGIPTPIVIFAAAALIVHWMLSRTSLGRFLYAHGDNPEAARLTGVAVRPLAVIQYMLSALLAWVAGIVFTGSTASMNLQIIYSTAIFDTILVVVLGGVSLIGGRGGVLSIIAGTALIGTLLNGFTIMDVNSEVQNIIKGIVLLAAILLDNRLHPRDDETARQGD